MAARKTIILAVLSLAAGLCVGLVLGWVVWPVQYYDTDIASLRSDYKVDYAIMVGAAFEVDGDWQRAEGRLLGLGEPDLATWIRDLTHQAIAAGHDPAQVRHLVSLAEALGVKSSLMEVFVGE